MNNTFFAIGRPWNEIKCLLNDSKMVYNVSMSRPTKDFFKLSEDELYVIRQRWEGDVLNLVLAARITQSI